MRVSQPPSFFSKHPSAKGHPPTMARPGHPERQHDPPNKDGNALSPRTIGLFLSVSSLPFFLLLHFAACASLSRSLSSNNRQSDQPRSQGPGSQVDPFCVLFFSQDASAQLARAAPCHSAVCSLQSLGMPSSGRQSTRTPAGQIPCSQAKGELLHRAHRRRQPGLDRERKHHHRCTDRHVLAHSHA